MAEDSDAGYDTDLEIESKDKKIAQDHLYYIFWCVKNWNASFVRIRLSASV